MLERSTCVSTWRGKMTWHGNTGADGQRARFPRLLCNLHQQSKPCVVLLFETKLGGSVSQWPVFLPLQHRCYDGKNMVEVHKKQSCYVSQRIENLLSCFKRKCLLYPGVLLDNPQLKRVS